MASAPEDTDLSHYALLGVALDADERTIRAAYLKLMKKAHPDLRRRRARKPADPSALNEAYRVLRDPRRRLAYDLSLRHLGIEAGPAPRPPDERAVVRIARRAPPPPPPVPISRRFAVFACMVLAGAAIGLFAAFPRPGDSRAMPAADPAPAAQRAATDAAPPSSFWVDGAMVERAVDHLVWIRRFGDSGDAGRYSRNCFDELRAMPNPLLLDHCVAFDLAAAQWIGGEMRFTDAEAGARHRAALNLVAAGQPELGERLHDIRAATISTLARRVIPDPAPPGPQPAAPAAR